MFLHEVCLGHLRGYLGVIGVEVFGPRTRTSWVSGVFSSCTAGASGCLGFYV